ncbi:phosphoribosylglycinamide formyltransferase [Dimargaris cristalligena]|uniref:phosphoribosylglycinamide formyltransferase 1 n=1 Tax=Dimargaris cristalligena TaxID=215637 RepID=A0A4P9ZTX1_9FUNG|nr:phosphoribosylglycinamide formyltransferase [Dimargaris cristalligena]RKP36222.1 phosphoribosylglycinamide formyltransferase [Dimargaris cristalligena]|eukprot:RKP36222.1 phosphoribosylglycinamide formyltransferase [Dimargaris cristalligena]
MVARVVVLISGHGSNLQAILDSAQSGRLAGLVDVVGVVSNRKRAYGLERAKNSQVPAEAFTLAAFREQGRSREDYDAALADLIATKYRPDLVVLAGWMHILTPSFLSRFPNKVINLHPALPGQFDGARAIERAYEASRQGLIDHTGVMVHHVIPEVDQGAPIVTRTVPIYQVDTVETLEERIHAVEHDLLIDGIIRFLNRQ